MVKKLIVGVTGASGSIYAKLLLDKLIEQENRFNAIALVMSENGRRVWEYELGAVNFGSSKVEQYACNDFFAPVASGSAGYEAMVIVPCTMGTLGRIASGTSDDLICRAADVMLKERKRLILVTREAPLSLIHIENMRRVTRAGAIVYPASPSFYGKPQTLDEALMTVVNRVLELAGVEVDMYRWTGGY
jgi:4-hydroxy-3-polyprenylbenzoate decarboxylase